MCPVELHWDIGNNLSSHFVLCRLVVLRHWFAQFFELETEKTSQNQPFVPCVTLHHDTRTLKWPRMPSDCTTAYLLSSNYCIHHRTGHSSRYIPSVFKIIFFVLVPHLFTCLKHRDKHLHNFIQTYWL